MHLALRYMSVAALMVLPQAPGAPTQPNDSTVSIREVKRMGEIPTFAVEFDEPGTGNLGRLTFMNQTLWIKSAALSRRDHRVVVLGETGAAQMVTIIDTSARKVTDEFYALNASISPTGRWIAYTHFRGRGAPESGAVYAIYDAGLPPAANRVVPGAKAGWGVGVPVFPEPEHRGLHWGGVLDGYGHVSMSPIAWISNDVAAVVDRSDNEVRLVTFSLSRGARDVVVRTAPLDVDSLVDAARLGIGEEPSRLLLAESISTLPDDPESLLVIFKRLPELRVRSVRVRVW